MEIYSSSPDWLSELEMEDLTLFNQHQTNPINSYSLLNELNFQSERPAKQSRTSSWSSCTSTQQQLITPTKTSPSSSQFISFDNSNFNSSPAISQEIHGLDYDLINPKIEPVYQYHDGDIKRASSHAEGGTKRSTGTMTRSALHAQEHVIAERKRREKLNQYFIALSVLLPGLKKMDRASVLGDAIKYLKQLQERVKLLEEQTTQKTIDSAEMVIMKKSNFCSYDDDETSSSSDENFNNNRSKLHLPEIEARVSDKDVIIRIHCEKKKGCVVNILTQIEKFHLAVVSSNVLPFGNTTLHITIVAQMDVELETAVKDLVKNLRQALLQFM